MFLVNWGQPMRNFHLSAVIPLFQFEKAENLAMAKCGPNTNDGQRFITLEPTLRSNKKPTIFSKLMNGHGVIQKKIIHLTVKKCI